MRDSSLSKRRVVITGLGIVSPIGIGVAENWRNIEAGKSGITRVTHFDTTGYPSTIAGEVKNFDPTRFGITEKEARRMDRFIQLGMAAGIATLTLCRAEGFYESLHRRARAVADGLQGAAAGAGLAIPG